MAEVETFAKFFGGFVAPQPPTAGSVTNTLVSDYEGEWAFVDGIEVAGYRFGPQRTWPGTAPTAPDSGVKVRRCNPTQQEIMVSAASGAGFETDDTIITIWAQTLFDDDTIIEPKKGDFVTLDDDWRILTVKRTVDYSQWRCMCRKSVL
jgi:hypothetical protein